MFPLCEEGLIPCMFYAGFDVTLWRSLPNFLTSRFTLEVVYSGTGNALIYILLWLILLRGLLSLWALTEHPDYDCYTGAIEFLISY